MQKWKMRAVLASAFVCAAASGTLGMAAAAEASPTWLAPTSLATASATFPAATMAPDGAAAMAWSNESSSRVYAATRSPFGGYTSAVAVSPEGSGMLFPQVGLDAEGVATIVWLNGDSGEIESATVTGGFPSTPVVLSGEPAVVEDPVVAVDERGDAVAAWLRDRDGESTSTVEAAYRPAGGSFGASVPLSAAGESAQHPTVAIDAAGEATVVWERAKLIEASSETASGAFAARQVLSSRSGESESPALAVDGAGATAVAWVAGASSSERVVQLVTRAAGGAFSSSATDLSSTATAASNPAVAVDAAGGVTAAWMTSFGGSYEVELAEGPLSGGTYSSPRAIAYDALFPSLAVNASGAAVLGYIVEYATKDAFAAASYRTAGGSFGASTVVSNPGEAVGPTFAGDHPPVVAGVDAGGDGLAAFTAEGAGGTPKLALLDAAGPVLNSLSIPATGAAGMPASFSVAPADQISSVASTTWSFGDASSASGTSVTHTFADPGTYSVSVTSTDASGNSTTATGKIVISAEAPKGAVTPIEEFKGARLITSSVRANAKGGFRLSVRCVASTDCDTGDVRLTLKLKVDRLPAATVSLGKDKFKAGSGARADVTFELKRSLLALLRKQRKLELSAVVEASDYRGQSATSEAKATLKPPKPAKKRAEGRRR